MTGPDSLALRSVDVWRASPRGPSTKVVTGASVDVPAGGRLVILGPNGAGKTSLLLALVGALAFEGGIEVGGRSLDASTVTEIRRRVGFVFADPADQLFLDTVFDEVAFGPRQRGAADDAVRGVVESCLARVRLAVDPLRNPLELSLGEQKRVALATALAIDASMLLFDEPTAMLDPVARDEMVAVLREAPATLVVATHDLDAAREWGGTALLLEGGRPVACGPTAGLLADPAALEAAGLAPPR